MREYLSKEPKAEELLKFTFRKVRTKRLKKKIAKDPFRYAEHYIQKPAWEEYKFKRWRGLGEVLSEEVYSQLNQISFLNSLFVIEPLG